MTEVYTISTALTSGLLEHQLQKEIQDDVGIAPNVTGIIGDYGADTATIIFDVLFFCATGSLQDTLTLNNNILVVESYII